MIFLEYAVDVAAACRERGVASVAVSAGYVCPEPRAEFFAAMDAVNIDLKAFTEDFYWSLTKGHLEPVLDTLRYLVHETSVWVEITTLLIPGENDADAELEALSRWVAEQLRPDVPIHFTAFHPDYRMLDKARTPHATLIRAHDIARAAGLQHVYVGNVIDEDRASTWCSGCGTRLIGRSGYRITAWALDDGGRCRRCGTGCHGVFDGPPGAGATGVSLSGWPRTRRHDGCAERLAVCGPKTRACDRRSLPEGTAQSRMMPVRSAPAVFAPSRWASIRSASLSTAPRRLARRRLARAGTPRRG